MIAVDFESMNNPDLLQYLEDERISIPATLHNELAVIRGVTFDRKADAARAQVISMLRYRQSRMLNTKTLAAGIVAVVISAATLLVVILKK